MPGQLPCILPSSPFSLDDKFFMKVRSPSNLKWRDLPHCKKAIRTIDRLGQKHAKIRIVNLHYEGTVETDVYMALRRRVHLFESVVGRLQPILA